MRPTNTYAGGIDPTAIIGHAPESRDWRPGDPSPHPHLEQTARVEAFVTIDAGTRRRTYIGFGAWLFKHAHIGHDAVIMDRVEIGTGAIIGGHAIIEPRARIGLGAIVLPHRTVGAAAIVGAGAVVTRDVPPGCTVVGNPARILAPAERNPLPHTQREPDQRRAA